MTHPDINTTTSAFKKLDFVVTFSYHPDNPGARYADILLPQMMPMFEGRDLPRARGGGMGFMSDRFAWGGNFFVYCQKCVDPPGDVKPLVWIWTELARRLGFAEQYNPRLANVPEDKLEEAIEDLHREAYEQWALQEHIAPLSPPSWEEFQKNPVFRWPIKDPNYPYKYALAAGENPFSVTPSGKIEFYTKELGKGPGYLAANEFPRGGVKGRWYGGGNLPPMAKMSFGGKSNFHSPDTKDYPLLMSSPHSLYRVHTLMDNQEWLNQDCYRHAVWISVADAKKRGIKDNQLARVFNDKGEMVLPAYVTSRVVPGTVIIFHGGWYTPGKKTKLMPGGLDMRGAPNVLTRYDEHLPDTIIDHLPTKALVEIEKWGGGR